MNQYKRVRTVYLNYVIAINSPEGRLWNKIISCGPKTSGKEHLRRLNRWRSQLDKITAAPTPVVQEGTK